MRAMGLCLVRVFVFLSLFFLVKTGSHITKSKSTGRNFLGNWLPSVSIQSFVHDGRERVARVNEESLRRVKGNQGRAVVLFSNQEAAGAQGAWLPGKYLLEVTAQILHNDDTFFGEAEISRRSNVARELGLHRHGTICVFVNSQETVFHGLQLPDVLITFLHRLGAPPLSPITDKKLKKALKRLDSIKVEGFFEPNDEDLALFATVAKSFQPYVDFFSVTDEKVAKHVKLEEARSIKIWRPCCKKPLSVNKVNSSLELMETVQKSLESSPLRKLTKFDIFAPWNYPREKHTILVLLDQSTMVGISMLRTLKKVMNKIKENDQLNVLWANIGDFPMMVQEWEYMFAIDLHLPHIGLLNLTDGNSTWIDVQDVVPKSGDEKVKFVKKWFRNILKGGIRVDGMPPNDVEEEEEEEEEEEKQENGNEKNFLESITNALGVLYRGMGKKEKSDANKSLIPVLSKDVKSVKSTPDKPIDGDFFLSAYEEDDDLHNIFDPNQDNDVLPTTEEGDVASKSRLNQKELKDNAIGNKYNKGHVHPKENIHKKTTDNLSNKHKKIAIKTQDKFQNLKRGKNYKDAKAHKTESGDKRVAVKEENEYIVSQYEENDALSDILSYNEKIPPSSNKVDDTEYIAKLSQGTKYHTMNRHVGKDSKQILKSTETHLDGIPEEHKNIQEEGELIFEDNSLNDDSVISFEENDDLAQIFASGETRDGSQNEDIHFNNSRSTLADSQIGGTAKNQDQVNEQQKLEDESDGIVPFDDDDEDLMSIFSFEEPKTIETVEDTSLLSGEGTDMSSHTKEYIEDAAQVRVVEITPNPTDPAKQSISKRSSAGEDLRSDASDDIQFISFEEDDDLASIFSSSDAADRNANKKPRKSSLNAKRLMPADPVVKMVTDSSVVRGELSKREKKSISPEDRSSLEFVPFEEDDDLTSLFSSSDFADSKAETMFPKPHTNAKIDHKSSSDLRKAAMKRPKTQSEHQNVVSLPSENREKASVQSDSAIKEDFPSMKRDDLEFVSFEDDADLASIFRSSDIADANFQEYSYKSNTDNKNMLSSKLKNSNNKGLKAKSEKHDAVTSYPRINSKLPIRVLKTSNYVSSADAIVKKPELPSSPEELTVILRPQPLRKILSTKNEEPAMVKTGGRLFKEHNDDDDDDEEEEDDDDDDDDDDNDNKGEKICDKKCKKYMKEEQLKKKKYSNKKNDKQMKGNMLQENNESFKKTRNIKDEGNNDKHKLEKDKTSTKKKKKSLEIRKNAESGRTLNNEEFVGIVSWEEDTSDFDHVSVMLDLYLSASKVPKMGLHVEEDYEENND